MPGVKQQGKYFNTEETIIPATHLWVRNGQHRKRLFDGDQVRTASHRILRFVMLLRKGYAIGVRPFRPQQSCDVEIKFDRDKCNIPEQLTIPKA